MDLYEYQGKQLFAEAGIPVARSRLARDAGEARRVAGEVGFPLAIKAQVLTGGRGKAGGVRLVGSADELADAATTIFDLTIRDHPVRTVLLEEAVTVERELYLAITLDRQARAALMLFSTRGGVDIETVARETPDALLRMTIDPLIGLQVYQIRRVVRFAELGNDKLEEQLADVVRRLWLLYREHDATLVEINPLAVAGGAGAAGERGASAAGATRPRIIALDAKVTIDGNSLWRQPALAALEVAGDDRELRAKAAGLNFISLDGDIGVIGNGAGMVMSTLDQIAAAGGRPADFCDIGGGAKASQIAAALEIIAADTSVRAILVTIFGGITRGDEVARGVLEGLEQTGVGLPIVVRLEGTSAAEGRAIVADAARPNVTSAATADEAVRLVVDKATGAPRAAP